MDLSEIIREFKARVMLLYGPRFQKVIFDGPQSGAEEDTIPLLLVLEGDILLDRESRRIGVIVRDMHYSYGVLLSVLPVSASVDNQVYAPLFLGNDRPWITA